MFGFDDGSDFDIDRMFRRAQQTVVVVWIVALVIGLALAGGAVYLIIRALSFFGIL